jgi:hypothetical protein
MTTPDGLVVLQSYSTYVSEDHVILGNAAVLRCHIPSYVADTVHVDHWLVDDHIISSTSNWGINFLPHLSKVSLFNDEERESITQKIKNGCRISSLNLKLVIFLDY